MPRVYTCKYKGCEGCNPVEGCKTKTCSAYKKQDYFAHHEQNKEQKRTHYAKNSEVICETQKKYYHNHKQERKEYDTKYRNSEGYREKKQQYDREYHLRTHEPTGDIKGLLRRDGSFLRTNSMSEAYFLAMLDDEEEEYTTEVTLETPDGRYIADIYLPRLNLYVEVKADHYVRDYQMKRIEYLRTQGYSIVIIDSKLIDGDLGI